MNDRPIKELTYDPGSDVLVLWVEDGPVPGTFNRAMDEDGLYMIVSLESPDEPVGFEVVGFTHYASAHPKWKVLAESFGRFPGGTISWREPAPGAGLQQLVHFH